MITCLIYFTSQKTSAVTEPICSDLALSVRQTERKEARDETTSARGAPNGISMNPREPPGSGAGDSPAITPEGPSFTPPAAPRPPVIIASESLG